MIFLSGAFALGAGYLGYLLGLRRERGRLERLAAIEREERMTRARGQIRKGVELNRIQLGSKRSDPRYPQH